MKSSQHSAGDSPTVVIVGGGFSGAALAWHLHRTAPYSHAIVIIEPRDDIGRGIAYDTLDPAHRINVPALKMNLDYDEEGHFEQWLIASAYPACDPAAQVASGHLFPAREAFGAYVKAHVQALGSAVTHRKTKASSIVPHKDGFRVLCDNGDELNADAVVLAVCHTPPQLPASLAPIQSHSRLISNPWQPDALRAIKRDDRVLIVGTGLTMADTVASLERLGHQGNITAISRRGLRSQAHASKEMEPYGEFAEGPSPTALALLRHVRASIADASREDLSWHPVFDQLRLQGTDIWRALSLRERARVLHHLRPFWDTHRFRIAPQIGDVIARRIAGGTLAIRAASLRAGADQGDEITVEWRERRSRTWERQSFDAAVLATGPAHGTVFTSNPLLEQLQASGLARPDALGLGIDVDLQGRAIGHDDRIAEALFVAGPLARGTFGELMGAPDLARHARNVAESITRKLAAFGHDNADRAARRQEPDDQGHAGERRRHLVLPRQQG